MATAGNSGRLLAQKIGFLINPVHIVYFSGFLDLFGVSMIMPMILPYARDLGASPTVAGILGSVYGGLQLFSSPVLGQWSDSVGRHFSLALCLLVSGAGYMALGVATSVTLLLLGRVPLGIFKHSQNFTKTYLADLVPENKRSAALGNFNAASSMGFIIGPMVGGHVAELQGGFRYVAFIAGAIFWINAALVWFLLPEKGKPSQEKSGAGMERDESSASLKKLASEEISFSPKNFLASLHAVDWPDLWDLFLIKFLAGFSVLLFRSNYTQVLRQKFDASPKTLGYMMSYSGLVAALCGLCVGKFTSLYSSTAKVFFHMLILQACTLFCLTVAPSMTCVLIATAPLSFVTATQRVVATDLTLKRGGKQSRGGLMGLSQSVMSLARMLSPFLAGLAQEVHVDGPSTLAIFTTLVAVVLIYVRPQDPEKRKKKAE
ncbi:major facilitator superfamily domain-containing protein 9-like [Littorina saxatilis]|uniref:Major facilitator superfamily (MFS) profile domain-containing protein n=1 Tax=Littorina saxatilis TaxID=31220 RepID=A0AAN9BM20_9CAEN